MLEQITYTEWNAELDEKLNKMRLLYDELYDLSESVRFSPDYSPKSNLELLKMDAMYELTLLVDGDDRTSRSFMSMQELHIPVQEMTDRPGYANRIDIDAIKARLVR